MGDADGYFNRLKDHARHATLNIDKEAGTSSIDRAFASPHSFRRHVMNIGLDGVLVLAGLALLRLGLPIVAAVLLCKLVRWCFPELASSEEH